jgi:DNA-binding NtrC family response regulator
MPRSRSRARPDFDVVLSDIKMPGKSGLELVGELRQLRPDIPVVLMTAFGSIDTCGRCDARWRVRLYDQAVPTRRGDPHRQARARPPFVEDATASAGSARSEQLQGADRRQPVDAQRLLDHPARGARRRERADHGRERHGQGVVARTLHHHGRRAQKPFLPINCTAIPEGLLESELFGHVRGAFTGAIATKRGLFERADGGTLFLDEIGDMGPGLQAKLLRVLQDHEVRPVGSSQAAKVDVRIIAATNRNLDVEMEAGRFREDLYYRLNVIPIHLPPLRDRIEDIPSLVDAFVRRHSGDRPRRFSRDAILRLQAQAWRGNARELENVIERSLALCESDLLNASDLALMLPSESGTAPAEDGAHAHRRARDRRRATASRCVSSKISTSSRCSR